MSTDGEDRKDDSEDGPQLRPKYNPAQRLLRILKAVRNANVHERTSSVWASELGAQIEHPREFLAQLDAIWRLVIETEQLLRVSAEGPDCELFLSPLRRVREALDLASLHEEWHRMARHLAPEVISSLEFGAAHLRSAGFVDDPDLESAADQIAKLQASVEALTTLIETSHVEEPLRTVMLDHLEQIRRAIAEYKIRGVRGLEEALANGVGTVAVYWHQFAKAGPKISSSFAQVLKNTNVALGVMIKVQDLLPSVHKLMLFLGVPGTTP